MTAKYIHAYPRLPRDCQVLLLLVKESKTDNKYSTLADKKTVQQGFLLSVMGTKIKKKAKEDLQWFKSW